MQISQIFLTKKASPKEILTNSKKIKKLEEKILIAFIIKLQCNLLVNHNFNQKKTALNLNSFMHYKKMVKP